MKKPLFLLASLLLLAFASSLTAQMVSVVNSAADDEFAHPHDKGATPGIDESMDGFCEDSLGRCTFRAALEEAANLSLGAYVTFNGEFGINIDPGMGGFSVPDLSRIHGQGRVLIGANQDIELMGVGNNTMIQGLEFYRGLHGLIIGGDNNLIGGTGPNDGNIFTGNQQIALGLYGNNNVVKGNYIGIDRDNTGNSNLFGVYVLGENNTIGGVTAGDRNYISGNDIGTAVYTFGGSTFIIGNYIGTDTSSTQSIPNRVGIEVLGPNTTIGGISPQEKNVISGNLESGVLIGVQASDNAIIGNHIGVDITGVEVVPNRDGITLGPGSINTLVENNQIVSNSNIGILISGLISPLESQHHKMRGNTIELNGAAGIVMQGTSVRNIIGSSLTQDFDPNMIQFNGIGGVANVSMFGNPSENTIRKNIFRDNGIIGIDNCMTCQDGIAAPELTSYTDLGLGVATINGTHPIQGALIDIYIGEANSSGVYEGRQWIGSGVVDVNGDFLVNADPCDCDTIL